MKSQSYVTIEDQDLPFRVEPGQFQLLCLRSTSPASSLLGFVSSAQQTAYPHALLPVVQRANTLPLEEQAYWCGCTAVQKRDFSVSKVSTR